MWQSMSQDSNIEHDNEKGNKTEIEIMIQIKIQNKIDWKNFGKRKQQL